VNPLDLPRGSGYVCFDTSPLIDYAKIDGLPELAGWFSNGTCFTADVVTKVEIPRGLASHPKNQAILDAPWLTSVPVYDEDLAFIVELRELWGSSGTEDYGEAEVVALCKRYGWTAIMNDRRGRGAARRNGVSYVSTAGLLVAATAERAISVNDAWELHTRVEGDYDHPMVLPTTDEYRPSFERAVAAVRRWTADNPEEHWPRPLAMAPAIDAVLEQAVRRFKSSGT
jgi:predicted nucleic acid-binding protein